MKAIQLRERGLTYAEIADEILKDSELGMIGGLPKGYDSAYAWRDVNAALDRWKKEEFESAESIMVLELKKLDTLEKGLQVRLRYFMESVRVDGNGDPLYEDDGVTPKIGHFNSMQAHKTMDSIIAQILKVMERREKLVGLDRTIHHVMIDWRKEVVESGIDHEELFNNAVERALEQLLAERENVIDAEFVDPDDDSDLSSDLNLSGESDE